MGGRSKRVVAPIAEKPNPDSPLITPERKTIASTLASSRMLNPATAFGVVGHERMTVPATTSPATANSHSVFFLDPAALWPTGRLGFRGRLALFHEGKVAG